MSRFTIVAIALTLLTFADAAYAALTTPSCLAQKRKAWGNLRKCEATETAKQLQGKPADPAGCTAKFELRRAVLNQKAFESAIDCRFEDLGDGTILDYDTGLQWEKKDNSGGGTNYSNPHDVDNTYTWAQFIKTDGTGFLDQLNDCESPDGVAVAGGFAGHCDWRLPSLAELQGILLAPFPCGPMPCIDPIFGPTANAVYWSNVTNSPNPSVAWVVQFGFGNTDLSIKAIDSNARAVRSAL